ncbi:hypothetical protein NUW58_g8004 [Xylaria curta]|uniref:Uncharacterized protein n=1 Tax=Xylaria curta TaxID=42375 RepID=A0ACC1NE40_9PEZI|nr:hypothetical protein NUW58_g8004 [Xylaria curta]
MCFRTSDSEKEAEEATRQRQPPMIDNNYSEPVKKYRRNRLHKEMPRPSISGDASRLRPPPTAQRRYSFLPPTVSSKDGSTCRRRKPLPIDVSERIKKKVHWGSPDESVSPATLKQHACGCIDKADESCGRPYCCKWAIGGCGCHVTADPGDVSPVSETHE